MAEAEAEVSDALVPGSVTGLASVVVNTVSRPVGKAVEGGLSYMALKKRSQSSSPSASE